MNSLLPTKLPAFRLAARWTGAAAMTLGALFAATMVSAAPVQGTSIGNQASASYLDPEGITRSATSNSVQTTVTQVGSLTLTANGARNAAAGNTVYVPHTLTNTGNGDDSFTISVTESNAATAPDFTRIEVYLDSGTGLPSSSTPLCSITTASGTCTTAAQSVPGSNGMLKFVVAYSIPPTAVMGTWPSNQATVTAARVGTTIPYTTGSVINTDTITLTDQAAFAVTKSISQPAVAAGSVAWPAPATSGPRGTTTMYTFAYTNNGGAPGTLVLSDTLPAGMTYVANSAVWSSAPGTSLNDAASAETVVGIEYEAVAGVIKARVANVNASVSGTISFVVNVASGAAIGTSGTSNIGNYSPVTCAAATISASTACTTASTNSAVFTVTANQGVVFGVSPTPVADSTPGTPNATGDTVTMPSVAPGKAVRFTQAVKNSGNDTDTFNLSTGSIGGTGQFPAGSTFSWFASDGVTPLLDTTGDGIVDTGPMAAGASRTVVLQVIVPTATSVGAGPFAVVAQAKSFADATKVDAVNDVVTSVVTAATVDLTNTAGGTTAVGDQGPGPGTSPIVSVGVATGAVAQIPLHVKNNDSGTLSYTFSASQSQTFPGSLPAGFSVFYSSAACASPTVVTSLDNITATSAGLVYACVTVPASAPAGTQAVYFRVSSTTAAASTGVVVNDTIYDALTITVALSKKFTVSPDNSGQAAVGGSVTYAHTINNTGNQSCGAFGITANPTAAGAAASWTTAIYLDVDGSGTLTSGDTLITNGTVAAIAAGGSQKILVRVFVPGGAVVGNQEVVTVAVSDTASSCVLAGANAIDTTTVVTGTIRVTKTQVGQTTCSATATGFSGAALSLKPGNCIVYEVIATNEGASNVSNIAINDAIPPSTNYAGAVQPTTQCTSSGVSPAPAFATSGSPVSSVSCGGSSNAIVPGGTITMRFAVQITP